MAFGDWLGGGRHYISTASSREVVPLIKDLDYSADLPQNQYQYTGEFAIPPVAVAWTSHDDYAAKVRKLLVDCPISKACIEQRVNAIANIVLKIKGTADATRLLSLPNHRDRTMSAALGSWEKQLSVGGKLYLYYNWSAPGRPTVQSLRPDLVANNVKKQRFEYSPGGLNGKTEPELMFDYDANGTTVTAWQRTGPGKYITIQAGLQMIAYFNPLDSMGGMAAGDSALRSVDVWLAAQDLIHRKFASGGTLAGFIRAPLIRTEAEAARLKTMVEAIKPNGGQNLLANGMDFQAAQLSFAELQVDKLRDDMAEDICAAFGVSAPSVNVGASTHANSRSDDKIFYRNFAGPEANWLIGQLEWGVRRYIDPKASVTVDETAIQHLEEDLDDKLTKWATTGCVTIDECRAVVGLPPLPNGEGKALAQAKPATDAHTGLGQPETKPGGDTAFNANAGNRGDQNGQ